MVIEAEIIRILVHDISMYSFQALIIPVAIFSAMFYFFGVVGILNWKHKPQKTKKLTKFPFISIQIPTFNEPVALRCAEACMKMDYPKNKYEIIIGDDSTNAEISDSIDSFSAKHKGKIQVVRRGSNKGFKAG